MHGFRELLNRAPLGVHEALPGCDLEGVVRVAGKKKKRLSAIVDRLVDQLRLIQFFVD
jgi:hypothetical protein